MARELRKSENRMIAGVCGGVAEYFNIDPTIVRLAFVALTFAGGFMILVYILAWIIMPSRKSNINRAPMPENTNEESSGHRNSHILLGAVILIAGIGFLLGNFSYFHWWSFSILWPVLLIALGIIIVFKSFSVRERANECQ